jgi:hypothetical protein
MEWWQGLTLGTRNRHITRISKKRTVARIGCSRGGRKASVTGVKVAGIGTSNIKAKELDSGGTWVHTNGLGCIAVCGVDRESYGSDRCSVLVLTGLFKFLLLCSRAAAAEGVPLKD